MASKPLTTLPETIKKVASAATPHSSPSSGLTSETDRPRSPTKPALLFGVPALEKRDVWGGEFPAGEGGHPIQASDNEYHDDTSGEDERFDERNIRWDEAWMSFRAEGTEAESALFAGAHMPSGPDRRVSLELQLIYSRLDPLIEWGVLVQLKVSNERYGAENPATLNLLCPSCSVHNESDVAPPLKGLKCDLLTDAPAVQFSERFTCHPAFGNSKKRSNLALIEFNSARGFIKAPSSRSAAEKELLGMSTELNHLGPALSDFGCFPRRCIPCRPRPDSSTHDREAALHAQDEDPCPRWLRGPNLGSY